MNTKLLNYDLKALPQKPLGEAFSNCCRKAAEEGIVMLKNSDDALPLKKETTVSVFGRIQTHYLRTGTGSGGLVNVEYTTSIIDGLEKYGITVNQNLLNAYKEWEKSNPFDNGNGWASEPWFQVEMKLDEETVKSASDESDAAIVVIGRLAGEDRDNQPVEGGYFLTDLEKEMLLKVRKHFDRVIVLLNVGNIIDMKWIEEYNPDAVLYVWQGGQEGGNAVGSILSGNTSPSGKLSDTIAYDIADYPSTENFGGDDKNVYAEDIYVGYRYFNTFAKEKVMYPFGFGLSYTSFAYSDFDFKVEDMNVSITLKVKNIGNYSGKDVVQIYCSAPQGKLGKADKVLCGYKKTGVLAPGEEETLKITFSLNDIASFDDTGITGYGSSFILESGTYKIFVSSDANTDHACFETVLFDNVLVKKCNRAMAPKQSFERIKPKLNGGLYDISTETVKADTNSIKKYDEKAKEIAYTGDKGIKLADVKSGAKAMEEFIAQISDKDLACIAIGEGMNSPKVTAGTGCAFGGLTESLRNLGIPVACGTDGPSGIRMDSGNKATLAPNGTMLACTWNDELVEELYTYEGIEMYVYKIDALLGPGMNIHRHPLNGRNFEYFSEDPLLTGNMALAICKGISHSGNTGVIKHFCGNNQEKNRHNVDSVISQRALREIYLRPFEIVVRENVCKAVMTSYNPVNSIWSCGNYDLNTTILRDEWGYDGFVMSDWWAKTEKDFVVWGRNENTPPRNFEPMVSAQNDIYMVHTAADDFDFNTILSDLNENKIRRADLQRNAMNICRFLMNTHAFEELKNIKSDKKTEVLREKVIAEANDFNLESTVEIDVPKSDCYDIVFDIASNDSGLSQNTVTVYANGEYLVSLTVNGTSGETLSFTREVKLSKGSAKLTVAYPEGKIEIKKVKVFGN